MLRTQFSLNTAGKSGCGSGIRLRPVASAFWFFAAQLLLGGWLLAEETQPPFIFEPEVKVPMRDGVRLVANVYRPKTEGRFPVILQRTPYGRPDGNWGEARRYVGAGYVMVVQDCRGRGKSEGVWDPFRYEAEDGFDTQEWDGPAGRGATGKSGRRAGSYVGWTQWAPSPKASRYLKAMAPIVPFANAYEMAYPGGAFQLGLLMGWGAAVGGVALDPGKNA